MVNVIAVSCGIKISPVGSLDYSQSTRVGLVV